MSHLKDFFSFFFFTCFFSPYQNRWFQPPLRIWGGLFKPWRQFFPTAPFDRLGLFTLVLFLAAEMVLKRRRSQRLCGCHIATVWAEEGCFFGGGFRKHFEEKCTVFPRNAAVPLWWPLCDLLRSVLAPLAHCSRDSATHRNQRLHSGRFQLLPHRARLEVSQ